MPKKTSKCSTIGRRRYLSLTVQSTSPSAARGRLVLGSASWPVSIGRTGRVAMKREGDGATPRGQWPLGTAFYRRDRGLPPHTGLPVRALQRRDGWCDAVGDRNYNRRVRHPYPASAERLWREDPLYDVVVVVGYNMRPRVQGLGSAIFLHLQRPDRGPTAGCVALSRRDMILLLARLTSRARLRVPL